MVTSVLFICLGYPLWCGSHSDLACVGTKPQSFFLFSHFGAWFLREMPDLTAGTMEAGVDVNSRFLFLFLSLSELGLRERVFFFSLREQD